MDLAVSQAERVARPKRVGMLEQAIRLWAAAEGMRRAIGSRVRPASKDVQEMVERLHSEVGQPAFDAAWAEGLAMTYDEAVAYALDFFENLKVTDTDAGYRPTAEHDQAVR